MPELKKKPNFPAELDAASVRKLVRGRLALIFLLLLAVWWWKNSYLGLTAEEFPVGLFVLFGASILLSLLYFGALSVTGRLQWQVRTQFVIDIFLITGLVWQTGDVISPYITLYPILIGVAGFYVGRQATLFIAAVSAFSFSMLPILTSQSMIYSYSGGERPSRLLQAVGFNMVALLVVGLIAARFAERRGVDQGIIEAAESFADLNLLHERILESIRSGLITTDLEGKIYSFNRMAAQITGRDAADMIGQSAFQLFGENMIDPVKCYLNSMADDEFVPETFEADVVSKRSTDTKPRVTVACSIAPLIEKTGNKTGLIISFQDLTEIRTMEESLRRSDRLAAVGRMSAGLAHEIRNPLGSMSSALQYLQETIPPTADEAALIGVVLRESDRLNRIISSFLTYARPNRDLDADKKNDLTDVGRAIEDCLLLLRHDREVTDLHIFKFEPPKVPVMLRANETQLKQVFWNLSKNAIHAMPTGGELRVALIETPGKSVRIDFEDTGCGVDPEYLEHIFEPFSSRSGGAGLGLSIVHNIVTDHNGTIDVQSQTGRGTKFIINLPHVV